MTLAFLFPGQGSQHTGMLSALMTQEAVVRDTFDEASSVLAYDMQALVLQDPNGQLDQTEYTQPALLTASIALFRLWCARAGKQADCVAGHSLGEYSALVAADCIDFEDALRLVAYRGRMMAQAVPEGMGKMAAILGLEDAKIESLCKDVSTATHQVWPANFNCPSQTVIAGHTEAVEQMMRVTKDAGAKRAISLPVSVPSHTPLMQPAADAIGIYMKDITLRDPNKPVWCNVDAHALQNAFGVQDALLRQLVSPVRWTEIMVNIRQINTEMTAIEMGPGKVLTGLARRIDRNMCMFSVADPESMMHALKETAS